MRISFHCNPLGHIKTNCPLLNPTGAMQVPVPSNLRIIDGQQGRVEALIAEGRTFQLMAKEEIEVPEFVAGCSSGRGKAPS